MYVCMIQIWQKDPIQKAKTCLGRHVRVVFQDEWQQCVFFRAGGLYKKKKKMSKNYDLKAILYNCVSCLVWISDPTYLTLKSFHGCQKK